MENTKTYTSSVKVMRSHDYCHFEVQLGSTEPLDTAGVDAMRKEAARLADKAVEQYKIAKSHAQHRLSSPDHYKDKEARRITNIAEGDRTPEEKATLKAYQDSEFMRRRHYNYEDDWQDYDDED